MTPYGLGLDFEKPGFMTVVDMYRRKQRHLDAYSVLDAFTKWENKLPSTFDGSLPSEKYYGGRRIVIGKAYSFEKAGPDGADLVGTVVSATVTEATSTALIVVRDLGGAYSIINQRMTPEELYDYHRYGGAYFGGSTDENKLGEDPLEIFERFIDMSRTWSRTHILKQLESHPNYPLFSTFSDEDVRLAYADSFLAVVQANRQRSANT